MARSARRLRTVRSVRYTRGGLGVGPGRGGGAPSPLSLVGWQQAFWAGDPKLGVADGGSVSVWRPSGAVRGAYTDASAGLVLPGTTGNYASVPDSAALSITGDITLVAKATLTDWTPAPSNTLIGKWYGLGDSYLLRVSATQVLLNTSPDGTTSVTHGSTVAAPFSDGASGWIAASIDVDDGAGNRVVKFWTSTDGVTWTQLGATVTTAGATSIYDSSSSLEIGAYGLGATSPATGSIQVARVYSGSGFSAAGPSGTLVFDADFRRTSTGGFTADTGQNVVINSAPWGAHLDVYRGLTLPGTTGNYASTPDTAALSITGDITLVCRAALTDWTPTSINALISKWVSTGNQLSYTMSVITDGTLRLQWTTDGVTVLTATSTVAPSVSDGAALWVAASMDVDDGAGNRVAKFWTSTDGATWTQLGSTITTVGTTSIFDSTAGLEVGARLGGSNSMSTGAVQVARVYSGSGFSSAGPSGSLVFDADFRRDDAPSFTASTGQTVTINSTFNAVQSTAASQPTFRASTAAFNGRPTVQFDGGDSMPSGAGAAQTQPISVVVIGQMTTLGAAGAVQLFCDGISAQRMAVGTYQTGSKVRAIATAALDLGTADTNPHLYVATLNGASSQIRVDGTSIGTGTTSTATTPTAMYLGCSYLGGNFMTGHIAFVGWYVGDITAHANWPAFKRWVTSHYGITVA